MDCDVTADVVVMEEGAVWITVSLRDLASKCAALRYVYFCTGKASTFVPVSNLSLNLLEQKKKMRCAQGAGGGAGAAGVSGERLPRCCALSEAQSYLC